MYLSEKQIGDAVAAHFRGNGNIVLRQVRNSTGYGNGVTRTADMLSISTWPSRGLYAEGIEIKSGRGDLRKELADPAKAEEFAQYCTRWWLATPEGLTDGIEIPEGWGIIHVDAKIKASIVRPAATREAKQFNTSFACAVMRVFSESMVCVDDVEARISEAVKKRNTVAADRRDAELKQAKEAIQRWKDATGIDLLSEHGYVKWDLDADAHAFNLVRSMRNSPSGEMLEAMTKMDAAIAAMRAVLDGRKD